MRCASGIQDFAIGPVNQPPSFSNGNSLISYSVDRTKFLEEVILDPRMAKSTVSKIKKAVVSAGWMCNGMPLKVSQSDLYDFQSMNVYLD